MVDDFQKIIRNNGGRNSGILSIIGKIGKIFHELGTFFGNSVTFRPRSTSVAGTVSNAEGFACCCRAANDEDEYRVGSGQGFELTVVAVGHLGRNATWR